MHDGCKGEGEEEHRAKRKAVQTQRLGVQQPHREKVKIYEAS